MMLNRIAPIFLFPLVASPALAQDRATSIVDRVRTELKDPTKPFTLLIHLHAKEDAGSKFEAAFAKAAKPTRLEKGCVTYDLNRDPQKPGQYVLYERWKDLSALEAHLKADHFTSLISELRELSAQPPDTQVLLPAAE
jgi:quinol monooxygenase YgiN